MLLLLFILAGAAVGFVPPAVPHYYPIAQAVDVQAGKALGAVLFDQKLVLTRSACGRVQAFQDGCPHRGASFAGADCTAAGGPVCPYHGFRFGGDGVLQSGVGTCAGSARLSVLATAENDGLVWVCPAGTPEQPPPAPLPAPAHCRTITGVFSIRCNMDVCVSNVLDASHVSFTHSFGNRQDPEPRQYTVRRLHSRSAQATFAYSSGPTSASQVLLKTDTVSVHNWYVVPSTAVTTVVAGPGTKTVRVHASPTGQGRCTLFWSLTRDFMTHPLLDWPARMIMENTLQEDRVILERLIAGMEHGKMHGVYDKLALLYRKDLHS